MQIVRNWWNRLFGPDLPLKTHVFEGEVCALDFLELQTAWFAHPDFDEKIPVLWDLRNARFTHDEEKATVITRGLIFKSKQHRPEGRACILVSNKQDHQVLSQAFKENIETGRMMVTDSKAASEQWLQRQPTSITAS